MTGRKIEDLSQAEVQGLLPSALGLREWSSERLFGGPMLVLVAATLIQLYGVLQLRWSPLVLMLLYAAEAVAFAFWYGVRAALIQRSFRSFLGTTMICGVLIGFVAMFLIVLGGYDVRAGMGEARLPALILFAVYGWQAIQAIRRGLDEYDQIDALRIAIMLAVYVNWCVLTILACVVLDKGYRAQSGGILMLIAAKFLIEAMLRTRLRYV